MKPINTLSTFNGMGCIWYALKRAGIPMGKCYSSEIDKYATQANNAAYEDTIQLNDVTKWREWREWDIDWGSIDLFVGGSPCQGFSFAGKQLNFADPRSALFFEYVAIWNHIKRHNPNAKFLLENVNMKKEHLRVISEYLGVLPVNINSNLVSAQNRNRWYWTNIKTKSVGLFDELYTDIPQPEDKEILLKNILQPESEIEEKYYINSDKFIEWFDDNEFIKVDKKGNKKADQNKAGCLTAGGNSGGNHSDMDIICVAMRGRNIVDGKRKDYLGAPTEQRLEPNSERKTNCLTSVQKDNLITDGYKLRRLTPRECGRLQTFTDEELDVLLNAGISDTQLYKMFGNGWTVDVIAHILSFMEL